MERIENFSISCTNCWLNSHYQLRRLYVYGSYKVTMTVPTKEVAIALAAVDIWGKHIWVQEQIRIWAVPTDGPETNQVQHWRTSYSQEGGGARTLKAQTLGKHLLLFLCLDSFCCWFQFLSFYCFCCSSCFLSFFFFSLVMVVFIVIIFVETLGSLYLSNYFKN